MSESKQKFRLFASHTTPQNVHTVTKSGERFYRITSGYTLVYTETDLTQTALRGKVAELTDENIQVLTADDRLWLLECNSKIIQEETQRKAPEILNSLDKMVNLFQYAVQLEKMNRNMEQEGGENNAEQ